jgi:YtxH-like protein
METEELPDELAGETVDPQVSVRRPAGFVAGIILGAFLGAGLALLFAPERGDKTRGRLRQRMHSLREDAREGIGRAGSRTREELRRGERRFRAEVARAKERAERALD